MANEHEDDGLTEQERVALTLPDDEEDAKAGDTAGADDKGDEDAGDTEEADDAGGAGDDTAAAAATDDAAADDKPAGEEPAAEQPAGPKAESAPLLVVQAPADAEAKLAEIATQKSDLRKQYDDGDITFEEYESKKEVLDDQRFEIREAVSKAKLAGEIENQRQANDWKSTVDAFIGENPRYDPAKSESMYKLLDLEVRRVAGTDEFKNRSDSAAGREILKKAHENLAKELGFDATPKKGDPKTTPKKGNLPPSLHSVPAADVSDTDGGKYAALDRLAATNPEAYEDALFKMSDAERKAYEAAA